MKYRYREPHEMKDSGVEWLGMIPKEWESYKVKHLGKIINGYAFDSNNFITENGVKAIKISNIQTMKFEWDDISYLPYNYSIRYKDFLAKKGDLVFALTRPIISTGIKACFISEDEEFLLNQRTALLRVNNKVKKNYLFYVINSENFIYPFRNNITQTNQPNISPEALNNIKFYYPILKEQKNMINFLDKKCEEFDSVIAKKEMLINKLEEAKKSLISEVVTGKVKVIEKENGEYGIIKREAHEMKDSGVEWLGMIPKEWQVSKLKYFANINPKKKEGLSLNEIVSFVPMESVKLGTITLNYTKKISEVINGYTYFENNDILLAKVTPCFENRNIGICENLINGIGFGSTELNAIRAKKIKDIKYLYYFLQEESFIKKGASTMTGTGGLKRIPTEFLYNCPIPYCKKDEKIKMTGFLDKKCSQFTIAIEKQKESIEKLKSAKQSLISEAVTGKIEVL